MGEEKLLKTEGEKNLEDIISQNGKNLKNIVSMEKRNIIGQSNIFNDC